MKITVTAKPKKQRPYVEQLTPTHYIVAVREPPTEGRANQAILEALTAYFGVSKSAVNLVSGHTSKQKIFDVPDHLSTFEPLPKQKPLF